MNQKSAIKLRLSRPPVIHWGEITEEEQKPPHFESSNLLKDIQKSMQDDCLESYNNQGEITMKTEEISINSIDPLILSGIKLHKWMNNMTETMKSAEIALESNIALPIDAGNLIPALPVIKMPEKKHHPFSFIPTNSASMFRTSEKTEIEVPQLNEFITKQLLAKSVAAIIAHIGFEHTQQSILDILVDVLEEFMVKFCNRFAAAYYETKELQAGGFANVLDRVLVEMGFGGIRGLQNFYQLRVVNYTKKLHKKCQQMEKEYSLMVKPKLESHTEKIGGVWNIKVKQEPEEVNADVMETDQELFTNIDQFLHTLVSDTVDI